LMRELFLPIIRLCRWLFACGTILLTLCPINSFSERLPFKIFTTENGLPQNIVNRVMRDSHGFLWFCTEDGLSRFDGQFFTNYNSTNGLPHPQINHILEADDGSFWVATYGGGVVRLNASSDSINSEQSSKFIPVPIVEVAEKTGEAKRAIYLFQDSAKTIWLGSFNGLFRLEKDGENSVFRRAKLLSNDTPSIVRGMTEDENNNLWVWTRNGVYRRQPDGRTTYFLIRPSENYDPIRQIFCDLKGKIWIAHEQAGLIVLDENKVAKFVNASSNTTVSINKEKQLVSNWYGKNNQLPEDSILSLLQSSDGHLWIGTVSGITEFDGESFQNYTKLQGLPETPYNWLAEDINGNIWATTNQGAAKITRHGFATYQELEGIGVRGVRSIWESGDGELEILTPDGKFHQLQRGKFISVRPILPFGTSFEFPQNVIKDSQGVFWAATQKGLFKFPKVKDIKDFAKISPKKVSGLPSDFIMNLYEDSNHNIWISLGNKSQKLVRWERKTETFQYFDEASGVPSDFIASTFAEDSEGSLWLGNFGGGLLHFDNGQFTYYATADGVEFGQAQALHFDKKGYLWMGTKGGGVWKISNLDREKPEFAELTTKDGLSSDNVTAIVEDNWGRIYLGTGRGIDWIEPKSENIGHYSTVDGLNDNKIELSFRDRHGVLWFGTANSLAKFVPQPPQISSPPEIFITKIQIAGKDLPLTKLLQNEVSEIEINSEESQIVVDFTGIDFATGQSLLFQHNLSGAKDEWSVPNNGRSVNFANLSAGDYEFAVRAITSDGLISPTPATFSFKILRPIYQRWWFIASILILTAFVVYRFYKNRLKRLLEMERMRTLIATDLHDDIGANLTRISLLSEVAKQKSDNGNGSLLTSIADIARESVASMNDIVWAIAPEHDSLLDLTRRMRQHAEEIFALRDIDLEFHAATADADLKLSVGVRRDVLLIFKEAVNNAARHSDCTKVEIEFRGDHAVLFLQIKDNGKGFATNSEVDGQGLRSMTRRAKALGGNLKIDSRNGTGTTVEFELSLPKASFESRL
jgi:ligand-binding sensor domain-containing protein/two-component sensor histidine kinase